MGTDAEDALHKTIAKFISRFQCMEDLAHENGGSLSDYTLKELETFWQTAKRKESGEY